jgi:two-component system sensor histidine kinase MtrB
VLLLGTLISVTIRDGLFERRIAQLDAEYARSAAVARDTLASSPATSTTDVQALLISLVVERLGSGANIARGSLLASAADGAPVGINDIATFNEMADIVTPQLRVATLTSDYQVWQSVTIPAAHAESGHDEPGVVFGSVVDVPTYGRFGLYLLYSLQPEQDTLSFVQNALAVGAIVILASIGLITWLVTRQAVTPIVRASAVAARLADGHLEERMTRKGHDELATLARSFNEMAASLQDQISRMEALAAAQRLFVSDVSHELRTPLTTVRMAAEMIYDARDDMDPTTKRSAELLHDQVDRFEELLADLLEISRFDAGAAALDTESRNLTGLAQWVIEGQTPLADNKGVSLILDAPDEPVLANIDSRRIERVVRNLVSNAIEHAEGQPVHVIVGQNDQCVSLVVRDHGVGMTPEQASRVFDRFWRADPSRVRTTGGTGLGLSISLEDARLHNGLLEAWGKLGFGASFRLTLPKHAGGSVENPPLPLVPAATPSPQGDA